MPVQIDPATKPSSRLRGLRTGSVSDRAVKALRAIAGQQLSTAALAEAIDYSPSQTLQSVLKHVVDTGRIRKEKREGLNWWSIGDGIPPQPEYEDHDEKRRFADARASFPGVAEVAQKQASDFPLASAWGESAARVSMPTRSELAVIKPNRRVTKTVSKRGKTMKTAAVKPALQDVPQFATQDQSGAEMLGALRNAQPTQLTPNDMAPDTPEIAAAQAEVFPLAAAWPSVIHNELTNALDESELKTMTTPTLPSLEPETASSQNREGDDMLLCGAFSDGRVAIQKGRAVVTLDEDEVEELGIFLVGVRAMNEVLDQGKPTELSAGTPLQEAEPSQAADLPTQGRHESRQQRRARERAERKVARA